MKTNYSFTKFIKSIILFVVLTSFNFSNATEYTSVATGNWEDSSTWSPSGIPTTGDFVFIGNHVITVNSNVSCEQIEFYGGNGGISKLEIKLGKKLTVSRNILVIPTNNYNNDSFIAGLGELEIQNLIVGNATLVNSFPTNTRLTTLYVDDLTNFIINGNMVSTTHVNTNPVAFNESRIRHRSGTITLYGVFNIQSGGPGPSGLGYRTDNTLQGDSKIIFKNTNPNILSIGQTTPSFTGGIVEFNSISTSNYNLPGLSFKSLILNSNRTFVNNNNGTTIKNNGEFILTKGFFKCGINEFFEPINILLENNVEIIISEGSIINDIDNFLKTRLLLTSNLNKYNVTYNQASYSITCGAELIASENTYNTNTFDFDIIVPEAINKITINTTNGVQITNNIIINELEINCNSDISGSNKIEIKNSLNVQNNSEVTFTDDMITLKSNLDNTAIVKSLPDGTIINGKIIIERYLPNIRRQWRLLTSPVKGSTNNSVFFNWQNNGYRLAGKGIEIWGPTGTLVRNHTLGSLNGAQGNGLVNITNSSYNVRKFNNSEGSWSNVLNSKTETLFNNDINNAFLVFAPHAFLFGTVSGGSVGGQNSLTFKASGNLITGNVLYENIFTNKFYLIGNPYASPLDFVKVLAEPENSGINKVWFIDPTVSTYGGYVMWEEGVGYSNPASIFKTNNASGPVFQSGEAFFVKATSATSSLTIKETHKTDGVTNTTLNRNANQTNTTNYELFRILLEKQSENNFINADGCVAAFYMGGNNEVDNADGSKLGNPGENIALVNATSLLSIEHRNTIENNDFLTLRISNATVGTNYKLKLYTENFEYDGYAYLQDLFLGTTTEIPLDGSVFEYEYQITENTASTGSRFKILFQNTALSNAAFTATDFMLYPNPVNANESFTIQFHSKDNEVGSFDCTIYNALGQLIQKNHLNVVNGSITVPLTSSFKSGVYFVEIYNTQNHSKTTKSLIIE